MEYLKTTQILKFGIICLIFLGSFNQISCNSKSKNVKITFNYVFEGNGNKILMDTLSDTLFIEMHDSIEQIRFLSTQHNDTTFVIQRTDSAIYLKDKQMKITHNLISNKIIYSNLQKEYFTPYFSNNSRLDSSKVFEIGNKSFKVYRFVENQISDYPCYSYFIKESGFIAYTNIIDEYYSYISKIENNVEISNKEMDHLIRLLINDKTFFIQDWRLVKIPPAPY